MFYRQKRFEIHSLFWITVRFDINENYDHLDDSLARCTSVELADARLHMRIHINIHRHEVPMVGRRSLDGGRMNSLSAFHDFIRSFRCRRMVTIENVPLWRNDETVALDAFFHRGHGCNVIDLDRSPRNDADCARTRWAWINAEESGTTYPYLCHRRIRRDNRWYMADCSANRESSGAFVRPRSRATEWRSIWHVTVPRDRAWVAIFLQWQMKVICYS